MNRPSPAVFLQDFVDVDCAADPVSARITGGDWWLANLASAAGGDTESQLMRIGPASFGDWIARDVHVRIGRSTMSGDSTLVPLRWEDARRPHLFPVLDGNLEVVPLGPQCCRVVLTATYRPPFERAGQLLDHAFLHRVAESTVRSFLTQLGRSLEADVVAGAGTCEEEGTTAEPPAGAPSRAPGGAAGRAPGRAPGGAPWRLHPLT